jgi:hypothetical protein
MRNIDIELQKQNDRDVLRLIYTSSIWPIPPCRLLEIIHWIWVDSWEKNALR